jgi:DNA-nicking Smr family endonuclease
MFSGFNAPFRQLRKAHKKRASTPLPPPTPPPQPLAGNDSKNEEDMFWQEMRNVTPLVADTRARIGAPSPPLVQRLHSEENEALAELSDLVAGRGDFDVTDTDEYIEGCVEGLDPRLIRKLRNGEFSRQAFLDLHGMIAEAAHAEVERFVLNAVGNGLRCVLLIHGRGRNSPGQFAVLKDRLKRWLTRGKLARVVLAFATARPHDGGCGALYVLLRRDRGRKHPLQVLEGAKR